MKLQEVVSEIGFDSDFDYEPLEDYLSGDVAQQYNVPYEPLPTILEPPNRSAAVVELLEECLQHLTDLGYLTEHEFDAFQQDSTNLPARFRQAVSEYLSDDVGFTSHWRPPVVDETQPAFQEFLPALNERLSILTSLDGELDHAVDLMVGDQNIYSRVLHFRLKAYGVYTKSTHGPVVEDSVVGAYLVKLRCHEITHEEFAAEVRDGAIAGALFNKLGNAFEVARSHQSNYPGHHLGYYFQSTNLSAEVKLPYVFDNAGILISDRERRDFVRKLDKADVDRERWRRNEPEAGDAYDDEVLAGRRILQLLLWMTGYYPGRLDGVWGERSHQALLDFIKLSGDEDRSGLLLYAGDNLWIFSFRGCISRLLEGHTDVTRDVAGRPRLDQQLVGFDEDKAKMLEDLEDGLSEDARVPGSDSEVQEGERANMGFVRRFFQGIKRLGRRVYYGARTLVVSAINGLKNIWRYLRDEVIGPAANFFRHLFKQIREGIRSFFDGMRRFIHFVLRKPVVSLEGNQLVVSKFDMDSDCVCCVSHPVTGAMLVSHRNLVTDLTRQLATFMRIAGKTIALIISLRPPFGWIKLALKIGRIIFEEIRRLMRGNLEPVV